MEVVICDFIAIDVIPEYCKETVTSYSCGERLMDEKKPPNVSFC
jgi:hypothetical protein